MPNHRFLYLMEDIAAKIERLRRHHIWFPFPTMISFTLILLFTGHSLLGLNPRLGNPAHIVDFPSEATEEGAIWFSLSLDRENVVVTTFNRKVFRWPKELTSLEPLEPFLGFLNQKIVEATLSASLLKRAAKIETIAVIAVDQHVKFAHLKPI